MTKVGICLASNSLVPMEFSIALAIAVASARVPTVLISAEGPLVFHNREIAVQQALSIGCSHVWLLDSDMVFPADTLARLLAHDRDVVGCRYARRPAPHAPSGRLLDHREGDLQNAVELPGGMLLVHTSVFKDLARPYWRCPALEYDGHVTDETRGFDLTGYAYPGTMGEDYFFSQSLRRAGFRVWCDTKLSMAIGHVGTQTFFMV